MTAEQSTNQATVWNRQSKPQMYGAYLVGQIVVAVLFFMTGILDFTIGNVLLLLIVGYASLLSVRFVMNSIVVDDSAE